MLDGIDTVFQRDPDAFTALDVGGDRIPEPVCFFAGKIDLPGCHKHLVFVAKLVNIQGSAGDHQLDQIRLSLSDFANQGNGFFFTVTDVSKSSGHMSTGNGNGLIGCHDPGADAFS